MPNLYPLQDVNLILKDAGLVAASAAAQVGGVDRILNLGEGPTSPSTPTAWEAKLYIDVSAIEVGTGDELYSIEWQCSSSATFASDIHVLAVLPLGHSSTSHNSASNGTGRYILPVCNYTHNPETGAFLQYGRLYTRVAGTIATGINYTAFAAECLE